MVKFTKLGAIFPRSGDAGHGGNQFLSLKTAHITRMFGMDFIKKPANKL
jgi:hypothetical protein